MDAQFWITMWNEGRTNFHSEITNDLLIKYFPLLHPKSDDKVLVPLCGKTKDLIWLHDLKLKVYGVELHTQAVEDFFEENKLTPVTKSQDENYTHYNFKNIHISSGDFFKLGENNKYDFIYDRASLVALPAPMRKKYAEVIKRALKIGGKCLLISYEYDQAKMDGPPFCVDANEIHELYQDQFTIKLMESHRPENSGPRLAALGGLSQKVYILEKLRD